MWELISPHFWGAEKGRGCPLVVQKTSFPRRNLFGSWILELGKRNSVAQWTGLVHRAGLKNRRGSWNLPFNHSLAANQSALAILGTVPVLGREMSNLWPHPPHSWECVGLLSPLCVLISTLKEPMTCCQWGRSIFHTKHGGRRLKVLKIVLSRSQEETFTEDFKSLNERVKEISCSVSPPHSFGKEHDWTLKEMPRTFSLINSFCIIHQLICGNHPKSNRLWSPNHTSQRNQPCVFLFEIHLLSLAKT